MNEAADEPGPRRHLPRWHLYEHRGARPLPWRFLRRLARHFAMAMGVVGGSLLLGMAGYVYFEALSWLDAFLNAAMLLGGMGPVNLPQTPNGKLFAGLYALHAGRMFLGVAAFSLRRSSTGFFIRSTGKSRRTNGEADRSNACHDIRSDVVITGEWSDFGHYARQRGLKRKFLQGSGRGARGAKTM